MNNEQTKNLLLLLAIGGAIWYLYRKSKNLPIVPVKTAATAATAATAPRVTSAAVTGNSPVAAVQPAANSVSSDLQIAQQSVDLLNSLGSFSGLGSSLGINSQNNTDASNADDSADPSIDGSADYSVQTN